VKLLLALLCGSLLVSSAQASTLPGEVFPDFNTAERCAAMAASSHERIKRMAEVCAEREAGYKDMAKAFWDKVDEAQRGECEMSASLALGSYEILSDCLRDQQILAGAAQ
jgi:hypothetical protein